MYLQHLHTTHVNTSHCTNTLKLFRTRGEQAKEYENEERKLICLEWKPHRFTFIYYQTSNVWHIYLNVYPHSWWNKIENRNAECIEYDDKNLAIISPCYLHTYFQCFRFYLHITKKILLVIWAKCTTTKIQTTLIKNHSNVCPTAKFVGGTTQMWSTVCYSVLSILLESFIRFHCNTITVLKRF